MSTSAAFPILLYFNKTLLRKKLQVVKPRLWPRMEILSSRGHESQCNTWFAATFQNFQSHPPPSHPQPLEREEEMDIEFKHQMN